MSEATNITCKNCGNHFRGRFCNACGEKVYSAKDKSVGSIAEEVVHFVTHFDGALFTTIKTIFSQPGKMSVDYAGGIRKKYFKPVSFFLLVVVAYFLFPKAHGLNMQFQSYVYPESKSAWYAVPIARTKMNTHQLTGNELADLYDKKSPAFAKFALLLLIPMSAVVIALLYIRSRRFFFDHFILATELMTFFVFTFYLLFPFIAYLLDHIHQGWGNFTSERSPLAMFFVVFILLMLDIFTGMAFKTFFKQPLWLSIIKSTLFIFVFALGIRYVYNLLLYLLVMFFV